MPKSLPKYLIIDPAKGYRFASCPKGTSQLDFLQKCVGGYIERIVASEELAKRNYDLYTNEEGMMKGLTMNNFSAPFIDSRTYHRLARFGGPYGTLVLVAPSRISRSLMEEKFPFWLTGDEDVQEQYEEAMRKALEA